MKATRQISLAALFILATLGGTDAIRATSAPPVHAEAAPAPTWPRDLPADPHSLSNPKQVSVEHLSLDLTVDFAKRQISGTSTLSIVNHTGAREVVLDTNGLSVSAVATEPGERQAAFTLGDPVPILGRALHIPIDSSTRAVKVSYTTAPDASGLQWLEPSQTAGKKEPFLFTQSEEIAARTWIPCQDTPGVRMTYDATIHAPAELLAVMSASGNPQDKNATGVYHFSMPQPIPSYLLALAVGDLAFQKLGDITGVYAEPSVIEKAAWELADTPKMVAAAADLYGPYRWGRYDILVLPPSFPYGGMENPRMTFATPTILAGDRSLVSLVAHELAHSWSGNLVTNATWNDFWLNEGFTDYFERRIDEKLYGKEFADQIALLGRAELDGELRELGPTDLRSALHQQLSGHDPDDGVNGIAYEKGALFLTMLEAGVGRDRFDAFLRKYFDTFAFQSMDTAKFLNYMQETLFHGDKAAMDRLQVNAWVYGAGLPSNTPVITSPRFAKVDQEAAQFIAGGKASAVVVNGWTTNEWLRFLGGLPPNIGASRLSELDDRFHLSGNGNSEILRSWFLLAIQNGDHDADLPIENYLVRIGRRRLVQPLYEALSKTPEGKTFALRVYAEARPGYHAVTRVSIDKLLGWKG